MSMAGRMVRHARRRAGLTQRQLAAAAGVPQETIARIEAGRVDPRIGTVDRLLEATGMGLEVMPRLASAWTARSSSDCSNCRPAAAWSCGVEGDRNVIGLGRQLRRVAE